MMRIDKNGTEVDAIGTARTDAAHGAQPSQTRRSDRAEQALPVDHVQVSSSAALASAAVRAAEAAPDVRPDVVARAKAMLEAGELGADTGRLAEALIDRAIRKE